MQTPIKSGFDSHVALINKPCHASPTAGRNTTIICGQPIPGSEEPTAAEVIDLAAEVALTERRPQSWSEDERQHRGRPEWKRVTAEIPNIGERELDTVT